MNNFSNGRMGSVIKTNKGTNNVVAVRDVTKNGVEVGKATDGEAIYCLEKDVEIFNVNKDDVLKQIAAQGLGEFRAVFVIFNAADRSIASIGTSELIDTLYVSAKKDKDEKVDFNKNTRD